jgi:uncharacterized protein
VTQSGVAENKTAETRFVADVMVGKLARWLRILGFDTVYSNTLDDNEIVRIAETENRIILTRDTGLAARRRAFNRCILIESGDYVEQILQVLRACNLSEFAVFSRCLECNSLLLGADKEEVFEKVPPFVYLTQNRFAVCPTCGRVFWHGTHADRILERIRSIGAGG